MTPGGEVAANLDAAAVPQGIKLPQRLAQAEVGRPRPQAWKGYSASLIDRFGGNPPNDHS